MVKFNPTITAYLVFYIREEITAEYVKVVHISYIMVTCTLPDAYTLALGPVALGHVRIYKAKHSCPWYNYYIYIHIYTVPEISIWYCVFVCPSKTKFARSFPDLVGHPASLGIPFTMCMKVLQQMMTFSDRQDTSGHQEQLPL